MRLLKISPIIIFCILSYFLYWKITNMNESKHLSSAMLNKTLPELNLEVLEGDLSITEIKVKKSFIVNYFASWCVPCVAEHEVLKQLNKDYIIIGIGYKDTKANIKKFISDLGNPYELIMMDPEGRAAINLGLYGVPETYFINEKGKIKYRQVGPLTKEKFKNIVYLLNK